MKPLSLATSFARERLGIQLHFLRNNGEKHITLPELQGF
jgi:hypothetical protein